MFRKVLYPTDFSPVAERALEYVKKLKGAGLEEVVLLHVIEGNEIEAMIGSHGKSMVIKWEKMPSAFSTSNLVGSKP